MRKTLRRYLDDVVRAVRVAPAEVVLGLGVAFLFSLTIERTSEVPDALDAWVELALLSGMAGLIAWGATLLHHLGRIGRAARWGLTLAGLGVAVAHDLLFFDIDRSAEAWRMALLLGALALGVLLTPVLAAPNGLRDRRYHTVNRRQATRVTGVVLYALLLFAGLAVAIAAVDALFSLELRGEVYGHVFGWIAFALVPWVVVGGAPDLTAAAEDEPGAGDRVLRRFAIWLLVPLLVVYYLIVYAYFVRVAVLAELPRNILSPLVIAAGVLALGLVQVLARPATAAGGPPVGGASARPAPPERTHPAVRWSAPLFLPMAVFGAWAILLRVGQYGWTEFRYVRLLVLLALAALAVAGTWALVRRRPLVGWVGPAVLGAALLLGAVGPWSAVAVSRRSQQSRLESLLRDVGAYTGTPVAPAAEGERRVLEPEPYDELGSILRYLERAHGRGSMAAVVDTAALARAAGVDRWADPVFALGFERALVEEGMGVMAALRQPVPTALLGAGLLYRAVPHPGDGTDLPVTLSADASAVDIRHGGRRWRADLGPLVAWVLEQPGGRPDAPIRPRRPMARAPQGVAIPADRAMVAAEPETGGAAARLVVLDLFIAPADSAHPGPWIRHVNGWVVLPQD